MPNWCDNILTVEGSSDDIRGFVAAVRTENEVLSFERLYPTPPALTDDAVAKAAGRQSAGHITAESGMPDWWHWRVKHWGTKWDACDVRIEDDYEDGNGQVTYYLNTAWAPPEAWLREVARLFPRLRFTLRFVEEGFDFAGWLVCRGSESEEGETPIPRFTQEDYDNGELFWASDIEAPSDVLPIAVGLDSSGSL